MSEREWDDKAEDTARSAQRTADDLGSHPVVTTLARVGFVVVGLLHALIALIALRVAWGSAGDEQADQSGALAAIAGQPFGVALLWVVVVGSAMLALWYLTELLAPGQEAVDRVKGLAKAGIYAAIAWSAGRFAAGGASKGSSEDQTQDVTQRLMGVPAGQWLVAGVGLAVVAVGGFYAYKGATAGFEDDLEKNPGPFACWIGRVGYVAKGVALALVGVFFLVAAWQQEPDKAQGLDGALKSLKGQPYGPYLLTVVAGGLIAFALYCLIRARHARLE